MLTIKVKDNSPRQKVNTLPYYPEEGHLAETRQCWKNTGKAIGTSLWCLNAAT